ncbi:MAG TPA: hypothetical protein VK619_06250, partial [Pyrinomonadaceae bacterium]|nr:hypothetical protein [Pyrinomonadaceae bacterium]
FERPAGIMFVEIDPETGMLATDSCPQRERIAVTGALAPHFECYVHNMPTGLTAEAGITEEDSAVPGYQADNAVEVNARPLPRAAESVEPIEPPPSRNTHVEIDRNGRSTLVNDMRVNSSRESYRKVSP